LREHSLGPAGYSSVKYFFVSENQYHLIMLHVHTRRVMLRRAAAAAAAAMGEKSRAKKQRHGISFFALIKNVPRRG
jgi:hypothetical protein